MKSEHPEASGCIYDILINGYKCQCKYTDDKQSNNFYEVTVQKEAPQVDGKRYFQPYSKLDDIDFLIIETGNNDFFIIPKFELHNRGVFSDLENGVKGKQRISVHTKESKQKYGVYKWTEKYHNRFDLLKAEKILDSTQEIKQEVKDKVGKEIKEEIKEKIKDEIMKKSKRKLQLVKWKLFNV